MRFSRSILLIVVTVWAFAVTGAFAQSPDSLQHHYDSPAKSNRSKLDSVSTKFNSRVDSLQLKANGLLKPDLSKLTNKLRRKSTTVPDSLQAVKELDSIKGGLRNKIDSLKGLNLSTDRYTAQLDSVNKINPTQYIQSAQQEVNEWQGKLTQPVGELQQKIASPVSNAQNAVNEKLDLMRSEGGAGANLPENLNVSDQLKLPGNSGVPGSDLQNKLDVPDVKVPGTDVSNPLNQVGNPLEGKMDGIKNIGEQVTDLKNLPQEKLNDLKAADGLKNVSEKIGDGNSLVDKGQAYQQDAMNIAQGDLGEVKQVPEVLEKKATDVAGLGEIQKQEAAAMKQVEMLNKAKDPEALKQEAQTQIVMQAKDHFAGKEEVLQQAMDKVSKLKAKYSELSSIADVPKRVPNAMKGKPFIERIVPGLNLQIQKTHAFLLDVNSVLSYRISGRISAGAGWNERIAFVKWNKLSPGDRIYGPRGHVAFAFKKGFSVKAEGEKMNTWIPTLMGSPDGRRDWVWSVFVGIKKDYQVAKGIRGNAQILYNIYDDHDNSPYVDRLNVRMGFEFPMKKKPKKSTVN